MGLDAMILVFWMLTHIQSYSWSFYEKSYLIENKTYFFLLVFQCEYTLLLWLNRHRKEVILKFAIVCFDETESV